MKFIEKKWRNTLKDMGLATFQDWWAREAKLAESPNTVKGKTDAWSNVCTLQTPCGKTIYLKRQQNFHPNNWLQRQRKQLTFEREYRNYLKIKSAGVPVYDLIYFENRREKGNKQAIYVAEGLHGFNSLATMFPVWIEHGWPSRTERRRLLKVLLETVQTLHRNGILHNALSPRHLFFNINPETPYDFPETIEFRLIDFERLKPLRPSSRKAINRDIFTLHRRGTAWPDCDRIWFLKQYLGISKLDSRTKKIIRRFIQRTKELS